MFLPTANNVLDSALIVVVVTSLGVALVGAIRRAFALARLDTLSVGINLYSIRISAKARLVSSIN